MKIYTNSTPASKKNILFEVSILIILSFIFIGLCKPVQANFFKDTISWVGDRSNEAKKTVNSAKNEINQAAAAIKDTAEDAKAETERALQKAGRQADTLAKKALKKPAEDLIRQVKEPVERLAAAWSRFAREQAPIFADLTKGIVTKDGPKIGRALTKSLQTLSTYPGFNAILKDLKDANAGSLIMLVSGGGGAGVMAGGELGLAIDIDAIPAIIEERTDDFNAPLATLISAVGIQVGPAAGGGADFVIGYNVGDPVDVGGLGFNVSVEIKTKVGGSLSAGFDLSVFPPDIVSVSAGVGAGAKVQLSMGPSATFIISRLCQDFSLRALGGVCPKPRSTLVSAIRARHGTNACIHKGFGGKNGTVVHLWSGCSRHENTSWVFEKSSGYIKSASQPYLCLHKKSSGWSNGNVVHLWKCSEGPVENKTWIYDENSGYIRARSNASMCLHKKSPDWNNGNVLHLWNCGEGPRSNKSWLFSAF